MAAQPRPTVRRKRLGVMLRRLRTTAGVTMEQAADRIDGDKSKISRVENGHLGIRRLELEALAVLYGVDDPAVVAGLTALARQSSTKGWWQQYSKDLRPEFQERLDLEGDAARIHLFQPLLVPGLLQTAEYAREVIGRVEKSAAEGEVEQWVRMRLARQEILGRDGAAPQLVCVLDEAVLRRMVGGPATMLGQLRKLVDVGNPPELSIQVVPFAHGWHAGLDGAFGIYSYPDPLELDIVSVDYLDGVLHLEDDATAETYRRSFDQLRASALSSQQSRELILGIMRDLAPGVDQ